MCLTQAKKPQKGHARGNLWPSSKFDLNLPVERVSSRYELRPDSIARRVGGSYTMDRPDVFHSYPPR